MAKHVFVAILLIAAGVVLGGIIGHQTLGDRLIAVSQRESGGYTRMSANPDAATPAAPVDPLNSRPRVDYPDSYGAAARANRMREQRMSEAFRKLGATDSGAEPDTPLRDNEGYQYGGRFADQPLPHFDEQAAPGFASAVSDPTEDRERAD